MRLLFIMLAAGALLSGCATTGELRDPLARETIYQVSTISALQENVYDGATTIGMLKQRGDLGIGTFNALDGEMILLDGKVYRFGSDGSVTEMNDRALTPFAAVTFFEPDFTQALAPMTTFGDFQAQADTMLPTLNLPYAVRIDGLFRAVKTRAPRRQARPYPRLIDALANQPEFDYHDVHGTLVGFRLPQYFNGVNVPGWHLHFISADHSKAGHVLSFTVLRATFAYDVSPNLLMALPETGDFIDRDLTRDTSRELNTIEKGR
jgi:acetolactate decarboxylase